MSISTFPYETVPDRPPVTDTSRPDDHRVHDER